jgi:hypothetical protein
MNVCEWNRSRQQGQLSSIFARVVIAARPTGASTSGAKGAPSYHERADQAQPRMDKIRGDEIDFDLDGNVWKI